MKKEGRKLKNKIPYNRLSDIGLHYLVRDALYRDRKNTLRESLSEDHRELVQALFERHHALLNRHWTDGLYRLLYIKNRCRYNARLRRFFNWIKN